VLIRTDDLSDTQVLALLAEHLAGMHAVTPAEHVHALDLSALRSSDITFWTAWDGPLLLGCGALKELSPTHGEIKSMRTPSALRRRGAGRAILTHILEEAGRRGYTRVSLETGTHPAFNPAQALYRSAGFQPTGPFGDYHASPDNTFMTLLLEFGGDVRRGARDPVPGPRPEDGNIIS
jgi:putative acetyltransferase